MTFYNSAGARLTKTALLALTETPLAADPPLQFTQNVYQTFSEDDSGFEQLDRLAFAAGEVVPTSVINGMFEPATITGITPVTGPAAGGTSVMISGTNFGGTAGVSFGANAATSVKVVNNSTITCVTPAGTAGVVNVVVHDDAGDVTDTGAYTYT